MEDVHDIDGIDGPADFDRMVNHGGGVQTLWYSDGTIKFRHLCRLNDGRRKILAPETFGPLHAAHKMISADPLTLEPSIICQQCGLHGWIRDGRWESC